MAANGISTLATKEARQIAKLEYAQAKRKGRVITDDPGGVVGVYGTWSDNGTDDDTKNYYRSNNTYDATALPDTYNGNDGGTTSSYTQVDDNPNTKGHSNQRNQHTGQKKKARRRDIECNQYQTHEIAYRGCGHYSISPV